MNAFMKACSDGDFDEVMSILKRHKISAPWLLRVTDSNRGWTCLQWAAWHNNVKCLKFLLKYKNVSVDVRDSSGQTALHISLQSRGDHVDRDERGRLVYPLEPTFEIIKLLLQINSNLFVGCYKTQCARNIASSLMCHQLEVIKLLINCESFVNFSKHVLWHSAALYQRVDCMRYLLCRPEFDLKVRDNFGFQPYFILFQRIVRDTVVPLKEDIEFLFELLLKTIESQADSVELYFMLIDCFRFRGHRFHNKAREIFTEVLKIILQHDHPKKQLVEKILCAKLNSDYSLVILILFDGIKNYLETSKLALTVRESYLGYLQYAKDGFFLELFTLYSLNQPLFKEYITDAVETKWAFNRLELCSLAPVIPSYLITQLTMQHLFNFTKTLIFNKFDFVLTSNPPPNWSMNIIFDYLLNIFVPLWKCVNVPIELIALLRFVKSNSHYNFNETGNCINDYKKLLEREANQFEVVSLKNLSRMSLRKYLFDNLTHYDALSTMYSLNVPPLIKRFICYNHANLKF